MLFPTEGHWAAVLSGIRLCFRKELGEIVALTTGASEQEIRPVLDAERLLTHQRLVRRVAVSAPIRDYAVRMVLATHPAGEYGAGEFATPQVNRFVRVGASPRAAQALILGAKCRALLDGRPAISIDDLKSVALPALRHRIIMNFEGEAEGVTTDTLVRNIVETLPLESPDA